MYKSFIEAVKVLDNAASKAVGTRADHERVVAATNFIVDEFEKLRTSCEVEDPSKQCAECANRNKTEAETKVKVEKETAEKDSEMLGEEVIKGSKEVRRPIAK